MSSHVDKINNTDGKTNDALPRVIIIEQPSGKGLRFRYECEKKYAAAIVGVNSQDNKRTYPTIKILNWKGPIRVVVSCVTRDKPYRPHPHNLLGKIKVADGICQFELEETGPALCFENLSIQCIKKKDVEKSLALRKKLGVDPFKTGFDHAKNFNPLDLYSLRLCFEVFLGGEKPGVFDEPLEPVVTDPINDRRSKTEPEIVYITRSEGPVTGGDELGILCERADKDDIDVLFYHEQTNWEEIAEFHKLGVFKRVAIVIKTPPYEDEDIKEPVEVKILLRKRTTGDVSDSFSYKYVPGKINPLKRKRNDYTLRQCEPLKKALEKDTNKILPKNMDSGNAFNLPARAGTGKKDPRELRSITDLSANAAEYAYSSGSTSKTIVPKKEPTSKFIVPKKKTDAMSCLHDENANGPTGEQDNWGYSNTLNSDDWVHELLQTIEDDAKRINNKDTESLSEIMKEPDIKYITPEPVPNITISTPAIQNRNNFMINNNNDPGIPSINMPVFVDVKESWQDLPPNFPRDLHTLSNIQKRPQVCSPPGYLIHDEHPQYAVNEHGNQWSTTVNRVANKQPLMPNNYQFLSAQQANIGRNYMMNKSYGTPMQPFNQENAWHQIEKDTLDEFDPLRANMDWRSNQQCDGFTQ